MWTDDVRRRRGLLFVISVLVLVSDSLGHWDAARSHLNVRLTRYGKRVRTVLFASLTDGGVCSLSKHGSMDWRGTLPRYVAEHLNASVVVWDGVSAASDPSSEACMACRPDEDMVPYTSKARFSCQEWLEGMGQSFVDLVVVVGTHTSSCRSCRPDISRESYGLLKWTMRQHWIGEKTRVLHIPISSSSAVLKNQVVSVDKVILDSQIMKPVHTDDLQMQPCNSGVPENTLLYIARYMSRKGQERFLQEVDPRQLHGYRVEFFSSAKNHHMERKLMEIAAVRGLNVTVHAEDVTRDELFNAMICRAKGVIHYASRDMNPRILYESLAAHLPILITSQSMIPEVILRQPFVMSVDYGKKRSLQSGLSWFMRLVRSSNRAFYSRQSGLSMSGSFQKIVLC